jgi:hypothetical protein
LFVAQLFANEDVAGARVPLGVARLVRLENTAHQALLAAAMDALIQM